MNIIFVLTLFGVLYFPIFGRLLPPFQQRQETLLNLGVPAAVVLAAASILAHIVYTRASRKMKDPLVWPFIFLIFFVAIWVCKAVDSGITDVTILGVLRTKIAGPVYGLTAIVVLYSLSDRVRYSAFIPMIVAVVFLAQLGISMAESLRGVGFAKYEIGDVGTIGLEGRDMLDVFGASDLIGLGFKIPFSGQIGQHNAFGNQLPFYLIIFASLIVVKRLRWIVPGLATLVLFALVGNTTRVALFGAVFTSLLIAPLVVHNRIAIISITMVLAATFCTGLYIYWDRLVDMTANMDSMSGRLVLWQMIVDDSKQSLNIWSALFGFGPRTLLSLGVYFRGDVLGSVENQFLALWSDSGLFGVGAFIWIFIYMPLAGIAGSSPAARRLSLSLVFTIISCGLTMDLHMHFTSIVLLLISYDRITYLMRGGNLTGIHVERSVVESSRSPFEATLVREIA